MDEKFLGNLYRDNGQRGKHFFFGGEYRSQKRGQIVLASRKGAIFFSLIPANTFGKYKVADIFSFNSFYY